MRINRITILTIITTYASFGFGQKLSDTIKNVSFFDIQKKFYQENETTTSYEIDGPVQKFKRWEWFWEQRIDSNGYFPSPDYLYQAKKKASSGPSTFQKSLSGNWQPKGPFTSPGQQEGMGRLNFVAFHLSDQNTFWVGSPYGGLWKTSDNGSSWSTTTDDLPVIGVSDLAINPTNPNIMYIATGDNEGQAIYQVIPTGGVFKSIDGGNTWNITGWSVGLNAMIHRLLINPNSPLELIATTNQGIFKTSDGGATWINQQSGWFKDIKFKPNDPSVVYATTYSYSGDAQIFKSTDSGNTWIQITSFNGTGRIELGVTPDNPEILDAVTVDYQTWGLEGVYRSTNSGSSFTQLVSGDCISTNMLTNTYGGNGCNAYGYYALCYAINPNNANEMWIGGVNLWKSNDGGATWEINTYNFPGYGKPVVHADKHFLAYNPLSPNKFYTCSDGGLQFTNDGGQSWSDLSNGLQISQIYRLNTSGSATNKVLCGLQDNGTKELISSNWNTRVSSWDGMECAYDYSNPNIAYAGFQQGGLRRTTDNWSTETIISSNINGFIYGEGAWITPFIIHPKNAASLLIGYKKVYRTYDYGDSWTPISPNLTVSYLRNLQIAPSDTNVIYTTTYDSLYVSSDAGNTWTIKTTGTNSASYPRISYMKVNPTNAQHIWMTYSGTSNGTKVFESTNGGTSWTNISGSLPNVSVNCIEYDSVSHGLYVGTDLGVYYRGTGMTDWNDFNTGLPNVVVSELEISFVDNSLWAATYGRGLWKSDLCCSGVGIQEIATNDVIIVAYPNPSNGLIILETNFADELKYDVSVVDVIGNVVYTKTNIADGSIELALDNQKSGVYFIRVQTKNGSKALKIVLE